VVRQSWNGHPFKRLMSRRPQGFESVGDGKARSVSAVPHDGLRPFRHIFGP
jgi:hypothetical protein